MLRSRWWEHPDSAAPEDSQKSRTRFFSTAGTRTDTRFSLCTRIRRDGLTWIVGAGRQGAGSRHYRLVSHSGSVSGSATAFSCDVSDSPEHKSNSNLVRNTVERLGSPFPYGSSKRRHRTPYSVLRTNSLLVPFHCLLAFLKLCLL